MLCVIVFILNLLLRKRGHSVKDIKRIQALDEMWIWSKMEKISWTAHVSNKEFLSLVQEQRCLMQVIKQRQANWIGHVLRQRHDCLLKIVLEGKMGDGQEEKQEGRCWIYLWSKRTRRSITRSWREEHRAGSDEAIVIGTCLMAEHFSLWALSAYL